jgi:hypothetical protein
MVDESGFLTPEDMRDWFQRELGDLTKEFELRVRDATDFVTAYRLGEITPEEAMDRLFQYEARWGESRLPYPWIREKMTNDEIVRRIDEGLPETVRAGFGHRVRESKSDKSR